MPERIDHLQRMRLEPEPDGAPDKDAPPVTPALIEYLEKLFVLNVETGSYPGSMDHMIQVSHGVTFYAGQRSVLDHLKTLLRTA